MMTIYELQDMAENESQPSARRAIAEVLSSAIMDWPTYNLISLDAFVAELRKDVCADVLTSTKVRSTMDSYANSSSAEDMWKAHALCGLLRVWDIVDEEVAFDEVLERIGVKT